MGDWAQVSVNVDFYPPWSEIKIYQKYCKSSQITAIFPWDIKFAAWGQRWDIFLLAARVIFAKDTLKLILLLLCGWQVVVVSSPRSGVVTSKNNCQLLPELRVEFEKQQQNLLTTNNIKMVLLFVSWPDNNKEQHRKAFKYVHNVHKSGGLLTRSVSCPTVTLAWTKPFAYLTRTTTLFFSCSGGAHCFAKANLKWTQKWHEFWEY